MFLQRLVKELYTILEQVNAQETPETQNRPKSFSEFVLELKNMQYDANTFAIRLKETV